MGVYKRKDTGKYEIKFRINGVPFRRYVPEAANKAEAKVAEATFRREVYEGRYGKNGEEVGSTDFVKFAKEVYLLDIKERHRRPEIEEYKVGTLCRLLKGKRLKDITLITVQGLRRQLLSGNSRHKRPRKPSTVKAILGTLSAILNMAIESDLLGLNPCRKLKWGRGQTVSKRDRVLSEDEEKALLPMLESNWEVYAAAVISLNTGLRRMGILSLKVSDVNAKAKTLRYVAKGGKSKVIPLNDTAWKVIETLVEQAAPDGHLFRVRTGHNLSASQGAFQLAVTRAKIDDLVFHDLRRTFSTRVRQFTDAFTVRDLMGHSQLQTTEIYAVEDLEVMRRAVDSLGKGKVLEFKEKSA